MTPNHLADTVAQLKLHPILVDVGASGDQFPAWESIMSQSIYVGFDPDERALSETEGNSFYQYHILKQAITNDATSDSVKFYLTKFPYCSSTLKPLNNEVANYHFASYFDVIGETEAPATTLDQALQSLNLHAAHWLKLDSQGTDLRIIKSLPSSLVSSIMAVDIEPGLINSYEGEDLFVDAHAYLIQQGFWLSHAEVKGAIRVKPSTLDHYSDLSDQIHKVRTSPGWVEARYLRKVETLTTEDEHKLLWLFAVVDTQYGYALDILEAFRLRFSEDTVYKLMKAYTIQLLQPVDQQEAAKGIKRFIPYSVKHTIKTVIRRLAGS